ncbi:site-specific recombinase XerD [Sinobaca qinghaiensis]|uniref:Site-specific recombinase XerD n=1 Tax=Sinobaca qinghaiensis TaxID=342944 RepID=A0A419V558_9BACL|nr:tyrosine-type recombinase/integrase [Sinobaca qinghaiensis]RKD73658.1 site-specific recombinase XerD [Sinobaca qinghaiensis]
MIEGKGSLEKRGKNRWRLRINIGYKADGRPIRRYRTVTAKNKTEANRYLAQFITEIESGEYIAPEKMHFSAFVEEWKNKYAAKELAPTTYYSYVKTIERRMLPVFGDMKLSDIKPFHIVDYMNELQKPGQHTQKEGATLSASVLQFNHRILKNIFSRAVDWEIIKTNPVANVSKPKATKSRADAYDNQEIELLFEALKNEPEQWKVMMTLVFSTGLRRGEVLGLEWDKVDLQEGTLEVVQTVQYVAGQGSLIRPPKTGRTRKMSLPADVVHMLKEYKHQKSKDKLQAGELWADHNHFFVFSSWDGKPMHATSVGQWWSRFTKRHGLKHIRFHDLRHTSATFLINRGVHPKVIADRLGHADIMTTMNIYGHVLQQADKQTAKEFDGVFKKQSSNIKKESTAKN